MLLSTARQKSVKPEDIPERLYIFSDMEFDRGLSIDRYGYEDSEGHLNTLLEVIAKKWRTYGYELPQVIFWNLDARHNNIPAINGRFAYISGFSLSILESVLSGKDGIDLMIDKLVNSGRYDAII